MKKNVNLLPPEEQEQIALEQSNFRIIKFGMWWVSSLLLLLVVLLASQFVLSQTAKSTDDQVAAQKLVLAAVERTAVLKQAESVNNTIANFQSLSAQDLRFSPFLIEFAKLLPVDVTIDTLIVSRSTKKVEVSGRAGTRESVLRLRENILGSKYFENVNFPLENLESARDVNWKYKFYLKTASLK